MKKIKLNLYDIFVILISFRTWFSISKFLQEANDIENIFNISIIFIFLILLVKNKFKIKELVIIGITTIIFLYSSYITQNRMIFLSYLLIIVSKNMDIKRAIKIMLTINLGMLFMHIFYFIICYFFSQSEITYTLTEKGLRTDLFLRHPNYAGAIILWSLAMYIYLNFNKIKFGDYILIIITAILTYFITKSRTSLIGFIYMFAILLIRNNKRIFSFFSKCSRFIIPVLSILTIFIIVNYENYNFSVLNEVFSGRFKQSYVAYEYYGSTFLGQYIDINETVSVSGKYQYSYSMTILDSFYAICFINYGIIYLIYLSIANYRVTEKKAKEDIIFTVLLALVAMTEKYIMLSTIAFPIIILGKAMYAENNKIGIKQKLRSKLNKFMLQK